MEINRKNTNTFSVSLIDRCSLIERERKKEENESLRLVSLYNIYIVCVFTFKLFFFVVKQEFLTEASTDLRQTDYQKKREKTARCSVMHEKKRAKNDDAFRCSREVL
jgi:hypothetical protein